MRPIHMTLAVALTCLWAAAGKAQQPTATRITPSIELTYDHASSNLVPQGTGSFGLNGGSAEVVLPIASRGLSAVSRAGAVHAGDLGSARLDLTLATYTAGVRYALPWRYRLLVPYAELQAGGTHASGSLATSNATGSALRWAFAGDVGGGVNVRLSTHFAAKLHASYFVTTYANGSNNHQNDALLGTGLVYTFVHH